MGGEGVHVSERHCFGLGTTYLGTVVLSAEFTEEAWYGPLKCFLWRELCVIVSWFLSMLPCFC